MIFGWDISTSIIGVTVLADDGSFVESSHLDLRKSEKDMLGKAEETELWVNGVVGKFASPSSSFVHFVEDRLGSFSAGRTMLQVLMKLAAFNMVVSYIIRTASGKLALVTGGRVSMEHIHPSTVKSIMKKEGLLIPKGGDKKEITLDFVAKKEAAFVVDRNRNDNPQPWCYDRADSYIVARAGFLRGYLSGDAARKKTGSPETRAAATREEAGR